MNILMLVWDVLCITGIIVIVVGLCIPFVKKYLTMVTGVKNYSDDMCNFVYTVPKTKAEIYTRLSKKFGDDLLSYQFDADNATITFSSVLPDGFLPVEYEMQITQLAHGCVLKIKKLGYFPFNRNVTYSMNAFWKRTVNATPMQYFSE